MGKKSIAVFVLCVLFGLCTVSSNAAQLCTTTAECSGADVCIGGACVPPVPDPEAYTLDAMNRWTNYVWTVQFPALFEPTAEVCCFDYTGDGNPDDQFGALIGLMIPLIGEDPTTAVNAAIENGELVKTLDWRELDPTLASGDVQLSVFDGWWTDSTPHADRVVGLGHTTFKLASFGTHGAFDQLNDGNVSSGFVTLTGNHFTLTLPSIFAVGGIAPVRLYQPRLEAPMAYEAPIESGPGLSTVDEDRGPGHTPQIVGGARLGGVITADEAMTQLDSFYRSCECAGIDPTQPVLQWGENLNTMSFDLSCTANTGDPSLCDPGDPCENLTNTCSFLTLIPTTMDIDLNENSIEDSWSVGLRLGFAGTTLDPMIDVFSDGFESGGTSEWSSSTP